MIENILKKIKLPDSWIWVKASEICSSVRDGTHDTPKYYEMGVPLVTSKNLRDGNINFKNTKNISETDHEAINIRSKVDNGDILFAMIGTIGNPVVVNTEKKFSIKNVGLFKKNEQFLNPYYLKYWFVSTLFERLIHDLKLLKGTTQKFIPLGNLRTLPIPYSPLSEQYRIVSKIEELFSDLDKGIEQLKTVQQQLKVYRQAVLKWAFEGKLTKEWRKTYQPEPAEKLLEQIKIERAKQYQQRLKEWEELVKSWEENGKKGKKPAKPKMPKELPLLIDAELDELSRLPDKWCWIKISKIAESMKNGIYKPKEYYSAQGVPCLRMYNIENGNIKWFDIKKMDLSIEEIKEYELLAGDLLVNRVNSRELVGKTALITDKIKPCVYESKNIRLRLLKNINSGYVNYWFLINANRYFNRNAQQTVGMASINQDQLGDMAIPLCSLPEQQQIVQEIESRLSVCDNIEATINEALQKSEALRQSILKKAFEGKLVPQDPNDPPASELLEQIKVEKEKLNIISNKLKGKNKR